MTTNLERIKYELEKSGLKLDKEEFDYDNEIMKSVYELAEVFSKQGHSGYSAMATLSIFKKLIIDGGTLSPLTDDPEEWTDISQLCNERTLYQSKRKFSCFSEDLKKYYDNDETSEKGERVWHKLKSVIKQGESLVGNPPVN